MAWEVEFHAQFVPEFDALAAPVQDELLAHVAVLEVFGPQLGRPRVDTLFGSRHANMKERRCDKSGGSQRRFYRHLIDTADDRRSEGKEETTMKNLDRIRKQLSPARRRKIAARAATLIAEERSLQELRQAHKLTQKRMAEVLGIGQDSVSRLEQRSDLLISTLRGYVEALGGRLSLVAEFPDKDPVVLSGLASLTAVPTKVASR